MKHHPPPINLFPSLSQLFSLFRVSGNSSISSTFFHTQCFCMKHAVLQRVVLGTAQIALEDVELRHVHILATEVRNVLRVGCSGRSLCPYPLMSLSQLSRSLLLRAPGREFPLFARLVASFRAAHVAASEIVTVCGTSLSDSVLSSSG